MHIAEYRLRFLLKSTTLRVIDIKEKADSNSIMEFNNNFCDSKRVIGFCSELGDVVRAPVFGVPLTENSTLHKVYFCELAIGNSIFVTNRYAKDLDAPSGADSLVVRETDTNIYLSDTPQNIQEFYYVIKNKNRVLPLYEVTFEYDEEFERKSRGRVVCNKCTENDATVFCPSERANFCKTCDEKVHSDPFLQRHERKYFAEVGQKKFFCCTNHPTKTIEYFCEECKEPLCTECKISGSHSTGDCARHGITPFIDSCRGAVKHVYETKGRIEENISRANAEVATYVNGLGAYRAGITAVWNRLEKEYKTVMQQLETIENQQKQVINAKLISWITHTQELKQMVDYPDVLDPADILVSLKNIDEHRKSANAGSFGKFDCQRPEIHGRISLQVPKPAGMRDGSHSQDPQAVDWRIKTMHISNNEEMSIN